MVSVLLFCIFIALFIFGMTILRTGLFNLSADSLKKWLVKLTDRTWKGLLAAIIITGALQSSSAVMVMTIGLISAGLLTFRQSIGIILGTNIGTTFTTEFITFQIDSFLVPIAILGALLIFMKHKNANAFGLILLGMATVFSAMSGFKYLAKPLSSLPIIQQLIVDMNESNLLSVGVGAVITALIHSSSATTGIIMGFLSSQLLTIGAGIAVMLGANIGTCVTGYVASIGGGKEARLCAYSHIWLNVIGVIAFFPFIAYLASIADSLAKEPDVQLAHISVLFNVISSLLVLPFASHFATFVTKFHGKK
ncbi:Na/Pi symporter [Robertmurraya beringensis]|uniref:Na/Pi symporter n=1 Tax=Robertmurraya beringensis TaxID=641660 RepID=A0ABV6KR27_9BACI